MTNSFIQATWNQFCLTDKDLQNEMITLSFGYVCPLVRDIPVYLLSNTQTGRFWEVIEQEIFS